MTTEKLYKAFPITSVSRADLQENYTPEQIDSLDDSDMERIASKMADAYLDQVYWVDLEIITDDVLADKKTK